MSKILQVEHLVQELSIREKRRSRVVRQVE